MKISYLRVKIYFKAQFYVYLCVLCNNCLISSMSHEPGSIFPLLMNYVAVSNKTVQTI